MDLGVIMIIGITYITGLFADDFHVYGVIWAEDYIGWYLDGQLMHSVTPSSFPQQYNWPFNNLDRYVMINFAIDSNGPNGNTVFPNNIQVDYVGFIKLMTLLDVWIKMLQTLIQMQALTALVITILHLMLT